MITTNNNDDDNDDNDMTTTKVVMVLKRLLDGGQSMEVIRQITLAMTLFSLMILSHWFRGRATSGEKKSTMFSQAFACFV